MVYDLYFLDAWKLVFFNLPVPIFDGKNGMAMAKT
jgi:hypothetical protein